MSKSVMMRSSSSADLGEVICIEDSLPIGTDTQETYVSGGLTGPVGFMEQFHEKLPELEEPIEQPVPLSHVLGIDQAKIFQGSL